MSTSAFAQCIEIAVSMQARQNLWDSIVFCKKIVLLHEKILSIPNMYCKMVFKIFLQCVKIFKIVWNVKIFDKRPKRKKKQDDSGTYQKIK